MPLIFQSRRWHKLKGKRETHTQALHLVYYDRRYTQNKQRVMVNERKGRFVTNERLQEELQNNLALNTLMINTSDR